MIRLPFSGFYHPLHIQGGCFAPETNKYSNIVVPEMCTNSINNNNNNLLSPFKPLYVPVCPYLNLCVMRDASVLQQIPMVGKCLLVCELVRFQYVEIKIHFFF